MSIYKQFFGVKPRKLLVFLALVLIIFVGIFVIKTKQIKDGLKTFPTPAITQEDVNVLTNLSQEELEGYYRVYKNPYVLYLRKALNAYLANDSKGVVISMSAVTEDHREGITSGLDAFDREYYKSKFVVVTIDEDAKTKGCRHIQIIFQDKPDRIFYAWICQLENGEYELRGFNSKDYIDPEAIKGMIKFYEPLLFDKEHAL